MKKLYISSRRMNVLRKITIPRIKSTLTYITIEMEEFSREELFRIKRIKQNKEKQKTKVNHEEPGHTVCPICSKIIGENSKEASEIFITKSKLSLMQLREAKEYPKQPTSESILQNGHKPELKSTRTVHSRRALDPLNILTKREPYEISRLEYLMEQLEEIITLGSSFVGKKIKNIDINGLLIACEEARAKIENLVQSEIISEQSEHHILQSKLERLKNRLNEVTNVLNEFRDEVILSPSVDNFVRTCEDVDEKLNIYMKKDETKPVTEETKSRLKELKNQIDDVVQITKEYQKEELLSPSVEAFLQSCELVKSKIDSRTQEAANQEKLDHLKEHVKDLESLTTKVKSEVLMSASFEDFLKSCNDFKTKLTLRKDKDKLMSSNEEGLERLVSQIEETIELSREAKASGLVTASVEDFIKSCEDIKSRIEYQQKPESAKPPNILDELEVNIDEIMHLISKFKKEGLITESMEEFIKSCEMTKAKVDVYKKYPEEYTEGIMLHPTCSGSCVCNMDDSLQDLCDKCNEIFQEKEYVSESSAPACDTCAGIPLVEKVDENICESCCKPPQEEEPIPLYITPEEPSDICDVCRRYMAESEEEKEQEKEDKPMTSVDSMLGYFEKKVRKIIRVTRTQNEDGTVREEKETIVVTKEKHDPNETTIDDNDEDFDDMSFESLIEEGEKKVALCLAPHQNQRGFILRSQSENFTRRPSIIEPSLRLCISDNDVGSIHLNDTMDKRSLPNNLSQSQSD